MPPPGGEAAVEPGQPRRQPTSRASASGSGAPCSGFLSPRRQQAVRPVGRSPALVDLDVAEPVEQPVDGLQDRRRDQPDRQRVASADRPWLIADVYQILWSAGPNRSCSREKTACLSPGPARRR